MAGTLIKIKRSAVTSVPASLAEGELAYSELSKQLFIGVNGGADIDVIGGEKFIDYLNHTPGVLTANAAVIVDGDKKIDNLKVDDIDLNGTTISTTATDSSLSLAGSGAGSVIVSRLRLSQTSLEVDSIIDDLESASADALATSLSIKTYVDSVASGLDVKESVRLASGAPIADLSDVAVADFDGQGQGVTLVEGDRVLVKDTASSDGIAVLSGINNGIYVVGPVTAGQAALTRAADADESQEITAGMFTFIEEGDAADSGWVVTSDDPITIGIHQVIFAQFSGAGQITAGDGIDKVGSTLSVDVTDIIGVGLAEDGANNLRIQVDGVTEEMIELSNNAALVSQNNAGTADVELIKANASDEVVLPNGALLEGTLDAGGQDIVNTGTIRLDAGNSIFSESSSGNKNMMYVGGPSNHTIMSNPVNVSGNNIHNVADPTDDQHAATKAYVDSVASGIDELGELSDVTLTAPAAGDLLIFSGTGDESANVSMSGDVTISAAGVTTIGAGAVENAMLVNDEVTITAGDGLKDGGVVALGSSVILNVEVDDFAGAGLIDDGSDNLAVNVDDSSLEIAADVVQIKAAGVTNAMLAESAITVSDGSNTSDIALGETLTFAESEAITIAEAAGTITIGLGTVAIANGGTGLTAVGTEGQVLQSTGSAMEFNDIDGGSF